MALHFLRMGQGYKLISVRELLRNFASVRNEKVDAFVVMRHGKPLGVFIPSRGKDNLLETLLGISDAPMHHVVEMLKKRKKNRP